MDNRDTVWIELPNITRPPREYLTCMDDRKEALAKAQKRCKKINKVLNKLGITDKFYANEIFFSEDPYSGASWDRNPYRIEHSGGSFTSLQDNGYSFDLDYILKQLDNG